MEITHSKNTICNFKRLLGRRYNDLFVQQEKDCNSYEIVEGKNGFANIEVNYLNERKRFTPEQITGIMFTKLKQIIANELATKPVDCVIGVPCFFTDMERRAMLEAAQIAGWNCLRLLNETTAVALCYGFYKADLPEQTEKPRLVAFVDLGYTTLQTSIAALNKGKLKMIATAFDPSLGGRDFDRIIMDTIREDFQKRYKIDSFSSIKSKLRLRNECEKAKKSMSTIAQPIPISIDSFIDDKDVSGKISRNEFETLAKPLFDRIKTILLNLLKESQLTPNDIESVEIVGGSTRIPAVKQIIQEIFQKSPMTTMNGDESVARGCTLMCAMLSPTFKVKEFKIEDCQPYPITLSWQGGIHEDSEVEVFSRWNPIPSTKILSFYKKEPMTLTARYSYPNDIPYSEARIGQYTIEKIQAQPDGTPSNINVKVRLHRDGTFDITHASIVESKEEQSDEMNLTEENIQTTTNEPIDQTKPKKKRKEIDLPIISRISSTTRSELDRLIDEETEMISQDKKEKERSDAKNAVEEYVYEMRDKLESGQYNKYSDEKHRQRLLNDLRSTENWLYDQGVNQDKNIYTERLKSLKNLGDPIRHRHNEAENRPFQMQEYFKSLQKINDAIQNWQKKSTDRYSHLEKADIDKVYKILVEKQKWYDQTANKFNSLKSNEDPNILCTQIQQERETMERDCWAILNKPKPKPKESAPTSDAHSQQGPPPPPPPPSKKSSKHQTPMDVN